MIVTDTDAVLRANGLITAYHIGDNDRYLAVMTQQGDGPGHLYTFNAMLAIIDVMIKYASHFTGPDGQIKTYEQILAEATRVVADATQRLEGQQP